MTINGPAPIVLGFFLNAAIDQQCEKWIRANGKQADVEGKIAALYAGLSDRVSGVTLNRFCASGLDAVTMAALKTHGRMESLVIAGGVESMSRVPMLSDGGAWFSDAEVAQRTSFVHMGVSADVVATLAGITRAQYNAWTVRSHARATMARQSGAFARSIVPVVDAKGERVLATDEWVRPTTSLASLAKLPAAFEGIGSAGADALVRARFPAIAAVQHVHTAATAPGRVDGASLVVVANESAVRERGLKARGRVRAYAHASVDPVSMLTGGAVAAQRALTYAGLHARDVDLWECNESFAATVLDFIARLDIDDERVNVNGGAIALGHPLGATGAMLVGTLLDELERRDRRVGVVAMCAGAGIGQAVVVERV